MLRFAALLLTVLTGFSGLVYEVTWQRLLATLLGSHSEATAAVLGIFLGGLAVGYALFGRFTERWIERAQAADRPPRLLFAYGVLEMGIGLYALLFPLLFLGIQALSFAIPHLGGGGVGFALDVGLAALLIGPPSVLMGGTIPILTQALARDLEDATRVHAWVYGFNTAGAFAGAFAAGFWILPAFGLRGALYAMGLINLFAGASFLALGLRPRAAGAPMPPADRSAPRTADGFGVFAATALLVGFAMMTVQTVLIRVGGLSFGASHFTFSMVVSVFVLCIALGSLAVSLLPRIPRWLLALDLWALLAALLWLYARLPEGPYWAHVLRALFRDQPEGFYPYYLAAFATLLATIGPVVALSGAALPLLFDHLRSRVGELGEMAGRLYSWNTVGSLLGALLGGYALLFWLDLNQIYRLALGALACAAALASRETLASNRRLVPVLALVPIFAALVALPAWKAAHLSAGLFRTRAPTAATFQGPEAAYSLEKFGGSAYNFYDDDPIASVAVWDALANGVRRDRALIVNGKSDGAVNADRTTMTLLGLVPALFAERLENAFVIGFGTGVTAGALTALDTMREVTVAEMSPAVMRFAPLFEAENGAPLAFPGTRVVRSDAHRTLMRSEERFDLIISAPSNPWVTGVEMLYSREFLEAARDRLAPGGVHCQWLHVYEVDNETMNMILRTYAAVFDQVAVWHGGKGDRMLIGLRDPPSVNPIERVAARYERSDFAAALKPLGIQSLPVLLSHEILPLGVANALSLPGELHTLLHPRLNHAAARAFFAGASGRVPSAAPLETARIAQRNSLLQRYMARRGGRLPPGAAPQIATYACKQGRLWQCLTLLAQWRHERPHSPARDRLEQELRADPGLNMATLHAVSRLFGRNPNAGADLVSIDQARATTRLFSDYYFHGAPFPRRTLADIWNRCQGRDRDSRGCPRARARTVAWLGDLSVEVTPAGGGPHSR